MGYPSSVDISHKNKSPRVPEIGTFYYPWYGKYRQWRSEGHNPPINWASNFLPDIETSSSFNPFVQLYDSTDSRTVKKQLALMRQAGIQFAISSWWGQNSYEDLAFYEILTKVMPAADNLNPDLKWTIYHEWEGFSDPTLEYLLSDLDYIKRKYTSSTSYMKIDGKPVIFVYNAAHAYNDPLNDFERWKQARAKTEFFVVMKVEPLLKGVDPSDMDGWHQYNPALRYDQHGSYYASVSPGYWKWHEAPRLVRDVAEFELAVSKLAAADVQFKLVQTWNEWGEGSGIEPAQEVVHNDADCRPFQPASSSYGNTYVNILGKYFGEEGKTRTLETIRSSDLY
jgi:hypothetical protein